MGGGASTTSTVFGLSEPQQGLGSQWSMEAKQSPRPGAASTESRLGWRPLWYVLGSEQRMNHRGSIVDNLRPVRYRSWRKKEHRRTQVYQNGKNVAVKKKTFHSATGEEMFRIIQLKHWTNRITARMHGWVGGQGKGRKMRAFWEI